MVAGFIQNIFTKTKQKNTCSSLFGRASSPMLAVRPVSMAVKPSTDAADAAASQRANVAADYAKVAKSEAGCCVSSTDNRGAIGYTAGDLAKVGDADLGVGCGTPVRLAQLLPGEHVVDLGCGAGIDCLLAAEEHGLELVQ